MILYIYALLHPVTKEIRYIGKTNNLKGRLQSHIDLARNSKRKKYYVSYWILKLLKEGLRPEISLLEECNDDNWRERESYYILHFKDRNYRLCNLTNGGEGVVGYEYPEYLREIRRQARIGWDVPQKTRDKIADFNKKKVRCVTDNIVFESVREATLYSNSSPTTFIGNLKKGIPTKGKLYEYV